MALDKAVNFAKSIVSTGYAAGATSVVLEPTDANLSRWPNPTTYGAYNAVWWDATNYADPSDDPLVEIVRVTALNTSTLTVTRAQEGTSDVAHNTAGSTYKMAICPTAKLVDDLSSAFVDTGSAYGWVTDAPYDATGDGVTDDYQAFFDATGALTHVVIPSGTYRIGTGLVVPSTVTMQFLQGALLSIDAGKTVTINGQIISPQSTISTGAGTLVVGGSRNRPIKVVESAALKVDSTGLVSGENTIAIAHGMATTPAKSDCMVGVHYFAEINTPWAGGRNPIIESTDATNVTVHWYLTAFGDTDQTVKFVVWILQ